MNGSLVERVYDSMQSCRRVKALLPLAVDGEFNPRKLRMVRDHLKGCEGCRSEEKKFLLIISAARSSRVTEHELPGRVRALICREAADRAARGRLTWHLPISALMYPARATIFGVAATLSAALLCLPLVRHSVPPALSVDEVKAIHVVAAGGVVRLAWSDGEKASYTVYKAKDPRHFAQGEVHTVKGKTTWTDTDPESSPVVFYRIE